MIKTTENKPELGIGIYTVPDIAQILRLPYDKVNRWVKHYWDNELGKEFNSRYSWTDGKSIAISFHTLVELFTFYQLSNADVSAKKIIDAHLILSKKFNSLFPFATAEVLNSISTDGTRVFFTIDKMDIINLDVTLQFNLQFIKDFFRKIDFNGGSMAARLWPLGKDNCIVVDPDHQFGQATISGTNINPETIQELHEAGEPHYFIASLYNINERQIIDALEFCQKAA